MARPTTLPPEHDDVLREGLGGSTVLVTGGGGFVGSRLVPLLAARGARVTVLDRFDAYPFDSRAEYLPEGSAEAVVEGDVADAALVGDLVASHDLVVHAAALADIASTTRHPDRDFASNVLGTHCVLEAARAHPPRRLLFVSSASVYADPRAGTAPLSAAGGRQATGRATAALTEDAPVDASSAYANSKLWGEQRARLYDRLHGVPTCVLRYFSVYGPPQVPKRGSSSWCVAWFTMQAAKGRPLVVHGDGSQMRDFVHVDDVAVATALALAHPAAASRTLNVGTGRPTSVRAVATAVRDRFPGTALTSAPRPRGDPAGGCADVRALRSTLGWEPVIDLETGLEGYAAWVLDNPHLIPEWL